jgi:hypothetical protein
MAHSSEYYTAKLAREFAAGLDVTAAMHTESATGLRKRQAIADRHDAADAWRDRAAAADERAYCWQLLADAVRDGLLDKLAAPTEPGRLTGPLHTCTELNRANCYACQATDGQEEG